MSSSLKPSADSATVYLAETSFDLQGQYDAIKRDLRRHGHTVLPDRPLPRVIAELKTFAKQQLDNCKLSIHLVGQNYGMVPDGAIESIVALQYELAIQQNRTDFSRLIWIAPDLKMEDNRQKTFIERLRTDSRIGQNTDLLENSLEDLKTIIYRKLEPTTKLVPILTSGEEGRLRIYLICDEYDVENIGPLEDYLFHQNYEVITPVFEGDEAEIRQMHEDYLRECHAVIIYYGVGNELWQRRKLSELRKSTGQGRSNPLLVSGIYVAPPATPHKIRLQTHEALVIRQPETGFNSNVLMPFLAQFVQNQVKRVD